MTTIVNGKEWKEGDLHGPNDSGMWTAGIDIEIEPMKTMLYADRFKEKERVWHYSAIEVHGESKLEARARRTAILVGMKEAQESKVDKIEPFKLDGKEVKRDSTLLWKPAWGKAMVVKADSIEGGPEKNHYEFLAQCALRHPDRNIINQGLYSWPKWSES